VDECGRIKEEAWTESLLPTTIDYAAPQLLTGTPKGRNWFHRMYLTGLDELELDVQSFTWLSRENPFIPATEVDRLASKMSERLYRQEILAEFLDDEGAVFRGVRECVGPMSKAPTVVLGVDLAKHGDYTVLHGLDAAGRTTHWERFNQISWPLQKERIIALHRATKARVWLDSTGIGDPILDDLNKAGVKVTGYKFTSASKQQLVEALSLALEQRRVMLPEEPVLLNELEVFEYTTSRTGNTSYSAPEGLHDDCVMALGLAWQGIGGAARAPKLSVWIPGVNMKTSAEKAEDLRRAAEHPMAPPSVLERARRILPTLDEDEP